MADEKEKKKEIVVHNLEELHDAIKVNPDGSEIVFIEPREPQYYGMAGEAMRMAMAMTNKAQTTLDKLDPLVEAQKKEDKARLMLLKKEQKKFVNKVNKQAQRR
jgi:predicted RNA binding protein with dsRBD fold (UPF0201 family)